MIYLPVSLLLFLLFALLIPFVWFGITIDIVKDAAAKLGFSPSMAVLLLCLIILGSTINIPLYKIEATINPIDELLMMYQQQFWGIPFHKVSRTTIVALNVGGGLIPSVLAFYQFWQAEPIAILLVTTVVTAVTYYSARVVPGIGIQMNPLLAPLTAALTTLLIVGSPVPGSNVPAIAFAGGVLGTLIGADVLHLRDVQRMTAGVLSIGGAGVFDGIALCGLFALLLT
jgi:uncharacterized membrane protein